LFAKLVANELISPAARPKYFSLVATAKRKPQIAKTGGSREELSLPRRKPPQSVDLTPHLVIELSLECEVDCEKPEREGVLKSVPA
jgi:hypothetical protein